MVMKVTSSGEQSNSYNTNNNYEISSSEQVINDIEVKDKIENEYNNKMEQSDKEKEIKDKDIKKAVKKLNNFLQDEGTHAEYSIHKELHRVMIKIIDNDTNKVILEVPPKKIVDMVAKMCELAGILVDKKA
jgi:flagellar protein FlaG